jgi:hypothetical protein
MDDLRTIHLGTGGSARLYMPWVTNRLLTLPPASRSATPSAVVQIHPTAIKEFKGAANVQFLSLSKGLADGNRDVPPMAA